MNKTAYNSSTDLSYLNIDPRFFILLLPLFITTGKWYISGLYIFLAFIFLVLFLEPHRFVFKKIYVWMFMIVWGLYILYKSPVIYRGIIYRDFNYQDVLYDAISYYFGTIIVPFMIFTLVTNIELDRKFLDRLFLIINVFAVALSSYSIYQFISIGMVISSAVRIPGLWGDLNIISAYLGIIFLINLALVVQKSGRKYLFIKIITMVIVLIPIYLAQTRAVWVAILVAVLLYGFKNPKILIPTLFIMALTGFFFFNLIVFKFLTIVYFSYDISTIGRLQAWYTSILILKDNLLFGNGFDSFFYMKDDYYYGFLVFVPHSHNTYLRALVEQGLIGSVFIFYLFFSIFFLTLKSLKIKNSPYKDYNEAFLLMFILLLIVFVFEPFFSLYSNSSAFVWFFVSLAYQLSQEQKKFLNA